MTSKLHTPVKLEESIWLDEYMIHRVQKMKKLAFNEIKIAKETSKKYLYTLQSVIVHQGEIDCGHYVLFQRYRSPTKDAWVMFDAGKELIVDLQTVLECDNAYQVVYKRDDVHRDSVAHDLLDITMKLEARNYGKDKKSEVPINLGQTYKT